MSSGFNVYLHFSDSAIFPVNPSYENIGDLLCYPSIGAIGKPVDLAIVIIPARAVLGALQDCAAAGVKNAIIISSGFAEEGGERADIGAGELGLTAFGLFLNDPRFADTPMILETEKSDDMHEDVENLRVLRGLIQ